MVENILQNVLRMVLSLGTSHEMQRLLCELVLALAHSVKHTQQWGNGEMESSDWST